MKRIFTIIGRRRDTTQAQRNRCYLNARFKAYENSSEKIAQKIYPSR